MLVTADFLQMFLGTAVPSPRSEGRDRIRNGLTNGAKLVVDRNPERLPRGHSYNRNMPRGHDYNRNMPSGHNL